MSRKENISNLKTEKEGITILRELMVPAKVVVVLLCFYLFFHLGLSSLPHICLLENTIHLHCPFCGLTFAFEEILRGNLLVALVSNPFSVFLPLYFLLEISFKLFDNTAFQRKLNYSFGLIAFFNLIYLNT